MGLENILPFKLKAQISDIANNSIELYFADEEIGVPPTLHTEVLLLYDALTTLYPNYVAKTVLGQDALGNNIVKYTFKTPNDNLYTGAQRTKDAEISKPKILVTSGIHGYEKGTVLAVYRFFKDLCNNRASLAELREKVEFQIIPVVCPSSYDTDKRINSNDVNINRNFTSGWTLQGVGTNDYGGASAASEAETQFVETWFANNKDAIYYIDLHNSGYITEPTYLSANTGTVYERNIKDSYLKMTRVIAKRWREKWSIPETTVIGYTGTPSDGGMAQVQANSLGIPSMLIEISWQIDTKYSPKTNALATEAFGNLALHLYSAYTLKPSVWITPTLTSPWTAGFSIPGYKKDGDRVYLRGRVTGGTVPSSPFRLPSGFRPSQALVFPCVSNWAFGSITVDIDGYVNVQTGSGTLVNLDGISFSPNN